MAKGRESSAGPGLRRGDLRVGGDEVNKIVCPRVLISGDVHLSPSETLPGGRFVLMAPGEGLRQSQGLGVQVEI